MCLLNLGWTALFPYHGLIKVYTMQIWIPSIILFCPIMNTVAIWRIVAVLFKLNPIIASKLYFHYLAFTVIDAQYLVEKGLLDFLHLNSSATICWITLDRGWGYRVSTADHLFFPDLSLPARRHLPHKVEVIFVNPLFFNKPLILGLRLNRLIFLLRLEPENVFKS